MAIPLPQTVQDVPLEELKHMLSQYDLSLLVEGMLAVTNVIQGRSDQDALDLMMFIQDIHPGVLLACDCNGQSAMFYTARDNKLLCCQFLFAQGLSLSQQDTIYAQTPAFYACSNNSMDVVDWIVNSDLSSLSVRDSAGEVPLFFAVRGRHWDLVRLLVQAQVDLSVVSHDGTDMLSLLENTSMSIRCQLVNLILEKGNPNVGSIVKGNRAGLLRSRRQRSQINRSRIQQESVVKETREKRKKIKSSDSLTESVCRLVGLPPSVLESDSIMRTAVSDCAFNYDIQFLAKEKLEDGVIDLRTITGTSCKKSLWTQQVQLILKKMEQHKDVTVSTFFATVEMKGVTVLLDTYMNIQQCLQSIYSLINSRETELGKAVISHWENALLDNEVIDYLEQRWIGVRGELPESIVSRLVSLHRQRNKNVNV